jgi:PAS domain S-box-containing protein
MTSLNWQKGLSIKSLTRSSMQTAWPLSFAGTELLPALFGFSAEDALGQTLDLIIPEHLRTPHWRGFEAAITKGTMRLQGRPTLTRALHKSGRKLYVEMTFAIVKGEAEGEVLGSVAIARDVTDRVERERAATHAA